MSLFYWLHFLSYIFLDTSLALYKPIIDIKYGESVRTSLFLSTLLYIVYRGRNVEDTSPIYFESARI